MPLTAGLQGLARRGSRWMARHNLHEWLELADGAPIVSITFDDVNASACETGAAILERHGCRGTFYVAGGLTDGSEQSRPMHSVAQLQALHRNGHQLGCHGWSHRHSTRLPPAQLRDELRRNQDFLRGVTGSDAPLDFAYPFGDYNYAAKKACSRARRSCRITGGGLHHGRVDLHMLGSYRLYGPTLEPARWQGFLDGVRRGGWAVLNTHGVEADCGPYGATPQALEQVIRHAQDKGCQVLSVEEAIAQLRARVARA